jgi:hypothetical protein
MNQISLMFNVDFPFYIWQLQHLELESPGPMGGGASEFHIFTANGRQFKSSTDMEKWYNDRILICHDRHQALHMPPGAFSGKFDKLVMCRLDFNLGNIIISKDGRVWLIDWGLSWAYPPWFEKGNLAWSASERGLERGILDLIGHEKYREEVDLLFAIRTSLEGNPYTEPLPRRDVEIVRLEALDKTKDSTPMEFEQDNVDDPTLAAQLRGINIPDRADIARDSTKLDSAEGGAAVKDEAEILRRKEKKREKERKRKAKRRSERAARGIS